MPPQQQKEDPDAFFDRVLKAFSAEDVSEESTQKLASLKSRLPRISRMAAKDSTLEESVFAFGLEHNDESFKIPKSGESLNWRIEEIPETKDFPMNPCLCKSSAFVQLWTHL
jgi:hypothetical protein